MLWSQFLLAATPGRLLGILMLEAERVASKLSNHNRRGGNVKDVFEYSC